MSEKCLAGWLMVGGHPCRVIVGETLMAQVVSLRYAAALCQKHLREMDFTGKPMKGCVYVAPKGIAEDSELEAWINNSVEFVAPLPPT